MRNKILFFSTFFLLVFLTTRLVLAAGTNPTATPKIQPIGVYGSPGNYGTVGAYGIYGQYGQYGQYGGSPAATRIMVDKFVAMHKSGQNCQDQGVKFVDNFLSSDPRFKSDQEVCFKVTIKNTSSVKMTNVKASDFIPQFLDPIEGPGNFSISGKTINFDAGDFNVGDSKDFFIKMKVTTQANLPKDVSFFCINNKIAATGDSASDEDNAQLCIEK